MKKEITIPLVSALLAVVIFNASMYFMNFGDLNLTENECLSMNSKHDEVRVIGGHVASRFGKQSYKYAVTYFVVVLNMKLVWTRRMIVNLSNCSNGGINLKRNTRPQ